MRASAFSDLRPVAIFMAVFYALFGCAHLFVLGPEIRIVMSLIAFGTTLGLIAIALVAHAYPQLVDHAHTLWGIASTLVLLNCLVHLFLVPVPKESTSFLLAIVGIGFLLLSTWWFTGLLVAALGAWFSIAWRAGMTPEWSHYVFAVGMAAALGIIVHLMRVRTAKRLISLHLEDVQLRTALLEAKEQAEAATEAKSALIATVSHEIRTPMNGVMSVAEMLLNQPLTQDQRADLATIHSSSKSLLRILNDLLDASKADAGHLELEAAPFDLRVCLAEIIDLAQASTDKGVRVHAFVEPDVPVAVVGDALRVRQVVLNLVSNALKFTEAGEIEVSLWAEPGDDVVQLHWEVRDTGMGIPPERLAALFEAYTQLDASTSRKYGGTGLGLTISKQLAERMGGSLWAESTPGKGSTFYFSLSAPVADMAPAQDLQVDMASPEAVGGLHVLVAEDNPVNQKVMIRLLAHLGHTADVVSTGKEALAAVEELRYDAILMDLNMPEMGGLEASQRIVSSYERESRPRLIALTGHASAEDRARCMEAGMDAYLSKPVSLDALAEELSATMPQPRDSAAQIAQDLRQQLAVLTDHDEAFAAELLETFISSSDTLVADAEQAVANGDHDALLEAVHSLSSCAGFLGLAQVAQGCRSIEHGIRHSTLVDASESISAIRTAYDSLRPVLEGEVRTLREDMILAA